MPSHAGRSLSTATGLSVPATMRATIVRMNGGVETMMAVCVLLSPIVYLTLRHSINAILMLLALLVVVSVWASGIKRIRDWERAHWVLLACFMAPLLTEGLAQVFRGELSGSALDGPFRFVLAGIVFSCLASRPARLWTNGLQWAIPAAVLICFVAYLLDSAASDAWGGRAATHFVDPITFGINVAILVLMGVVVFGQASRSWGGRLLAGLTLVVGIYLVLMTQARTAWTSLYLTAGVLCVLQFPVQRRRLLIALIGMTMVASAIGFLHPGTQDRITNVVHEVQAYFQGTDRDTSIGIRLSLMRLDIHLFASHPLSGVEDGKLPPFDEVVKSQPYVSPASYSMKLLAGSHSELFAQISRKGIWGLFSFLALVIIPVLFFLRHARHPSEPVRIAALLGTTLTVGYLVAGLTVQTFNLKYAASFYSLMVAVWAAQILQTRGDGKQG